MTRYGSVYLVTNTATGEQYVGQTRQLVARRWDAHWRTAICGKARKAKFQLALLGAGQDAFVVEELFVAFDAEALNWAEISIIAGICPAYNSTRGGKGSRVVVVSENTKNKRSEAAKSRWADPEWRAKTSEAIRLACQTPAAIARGKALRAYKGVEKRWLGHVKKEHPTYDRSEAMRASWENPKTRQKRIAGIRHTLSTPEGRATHIAASTGRVMPRAVVEKLARAKWQPLYCPEINATFLCGKYAAEYFGALPSSVANAVKQKGKLLRKYSLEKVV